MTDNALGSLRRPFATPARSGTPVARLKSSDTAVDPTGRGSGLSGRGERDGHERDERAPGDRRPPPPPSPPAVEAAGEPPAPPAAAAEPHPLVYLAVDTVTGEVLWQVHGETVAAEHGHAPEAYGPAGRLVYRQDADEVPHGLSKLA